MPPSRCDPSLDLHGGLRPRRHSATLAFSLLGGCVLHDSASRIRSSARSSDDRPTNIIRPTHSYFTERTNHSAKAFKLGDCGGSRIGPTRSRVSADRNVSEYFVSRSMIKNRVRRRNGSSGSVGLRTIYSIHSSRGCAVDFHGEEVTGPDTLPMRLEERRPRCALPSF